MQKKLTPEIIAFIEKNIDLIEALKWGKIYSQKNIPTGFTDAMLAAGINPLLQGLNYIPKWFLYESDIESFTIPNHIKSIRTAAFNWCQNLTNIEIPANTKSIGSYAFNGCTSLKSVTIPDSVTSMGERTFSGCISLTKIIIGANVTSIGKSMFVYCNSLTDVIVGNNVTDIGYYAFAGCGKLTEIKINQTIQLVKDNLKLDTRLDWREDSNVQKIICIDGEIDLA